MRRGQRIGICQWRELVIRRLRSRFLGGGSPTDFESAFHNSDLRGLNPDIAPSGPVGHPGRKTPWKTEKVCSIGTEMAIHQITKALMLRCAPIPLRIPLSRSSTTIAQYRKMPAGTRIARRLWKLAIFRKKRILTKPSPLHALVKFRPRDCRISGAEAQWASTHFPTQLLATHRHVGRMQTKVHMISTAAV